MALHELKRPEQCNPLRVSHPPLIFLIAKNPLNPLVRVKGLLFNFHNLKFALSLFSDVCP